MSLEAIHQSSGSSFCDFFVKTTKENLKASWKHSTGPTGQRKAQGELGAARDVPLEMVHSLDGTSFFIKIVPVGGSPGGKQVSILRCVRRVYTKTPRVASCVIISMCVILLLKSSGFLSFINLLDLLVSGMHWQRLRGSALRLL